MFGFVRQQQLRSIQDAVAALSAELEQLKAERAELKHIAVEWEDWFEKFSTLYARLNKRVQREEPQPPRVDAEPINPAALKLLGRL